MALTTTGLPVHGARSVDDCIFQACGFLALLQTRFVWPCISKFQRIGGSKILFRGLNAVFIEQQRKARARIDAEMRIAFWTNVEVLLKVFLPDDLAATFALDPEPFRADAFFAPTPANSFDSLLNHAKDGLAQPFLILNAALRQDAFFIGVLNLLHFGDRIGQFNDCRMRVAARQDYVNQLGFTLQRLRHLRRIEHAIADGVVDFIQHRPNPTCRTDGCVAPQPRLASTILMSSGSGFRPAHFHKAAAHLLHDEVVAKRLDGIQFTVMP